MKSWAKCLSEATKSFREECFRLLDSNIQKEMNNTILAYLDVQCNDLFFQQSHSAFSEICNLAMLCFETNTFPKKCSMLKAHEISLLNTELSLDVIMANAEEEMQRILTVENKKSPVMEKIQDAPSLEKEAEKTTVPDLLQDILSRMSPCCCWLTKSCLLRMTTFEYSTCSINSSDIVPEYSEHEY